MKIQLILASCLFLAACNTNKNKAATAEDSDNVKQYTAALSTLNKAEMNSLSQAVSLFNKEIKKAEDGDKAVPHLLAYINQSLDTLNTVLEPTGDQYASLVYDSVARPTPQQASFVNTLVANHTQLLPDGEGGIYLEFDYNWLSKNIGDKVSEPVKQYLDITAAEARQPLLRDAALMVPPQALVDRVIQTENLLKQPLPPMILTDLQKVNQLYTNALLFGADNTPSLDYKSLQVTPAFAQAYNQLLTKHPQSATAAKVKEWQGIAAAKDGKAIDAYIASNWKQ